VIQALRRFNAAHVETSLSNLGTSIRSDVLQPLAELLRNPAAEDWKLPARNWASVLQDARVRHARDAVRLRDQTSLITLWGAGKVHVHRAPAEVIESQKKLYSIQNVRTLEEFFSRGLRETTNPTDPADVNEIQRAFTDASSCYSVWIICDQGKAMSTLTVQTTETGSLSETETFAW
jgi:hypothetical protein